MSSAVAGLCRLRFQAPGVVFDLSVPSDVVLADLLPAVVGYAGADFDEKGVDHGGWILQRLGGEPLDEERTPEALGLRDGDELHLRPRHDAIPPVHFDDLVDGVRTGMDEHGDGWRPVMAHHLSLGLALLALAGGVALLALPGPYQLRSAVAVAIGCLVLLGATSASRAMGDAGAASALGAAAVPYLVLAAVLVPQGVDGLAGPRLLAAGSVGAGAAVLALAAVSCSAPLFLGIVVTGVLTALAGVLTLSGVPAQHTAAVVASAAVVFGAFVPAISFRLSGLRLPALPRNSDELQDDIEPFPAQNVLDRSAVADRYLTGFFVALGAVSLVCLTFLSGGSGWGMPVTAADLSVLLLLHGRAIGSLWQRLAVLVPGLYGLTLLAGRLGLQSTWNGRMALLAALLGLAIVFCTVSWTVPGRRLLPYWGRMADLLHTLTALALIPLAFQATGLYQRMRGMSG
ncbi:hypothetical protein KNE206_57050 [Kitasatospora sp. NE20-6]|uniref:type VII secretion integral membrane protein EccD n=1 Tax=Kitasatospora sp. NE20-6 TaxID=2859066 RepID=UPI0034DC81FF